MRPLYVSFFATWLGLGALALLSQVVSNSRFLAHSDVGLEEWARTLPAPDPAAHAALVAQARARAVVYDDMIQADHLLDGMIVNRSASGRVKDECDSLLFSSLRFVGLGKIGLDERAHAAWTALSESRREGQWIRHPRCPLSPSRDMLLGVLIALSQRPDGFYQHLQLLIERIREHDGYFADGPLYLSYITPGVARLLKLMAVASRIDERSLPDVIRDGHSTSELTFYTLSPGYRAHLIALSVWLELELKAKVPAVDQTGTGVLAWFGRMLEPVTGANVAAQALSWNAEQLVELEPENLFFRYLRLKTAGALTQAVRHRLLQELLTMTQFPADRLPLNCDRRADYLWQRAWREASTASYACNRQFNGSDYLWMAGLLLEEEPQEGGGLLAH
jgi:hypothetical protein